MKKGDSPLIEKKNLVVLAVIAILSFTLLQAHQSNTFYRNLLNKGEQAYLAMDYKTAIKEFKIAVFGLYGEKELRAKAYAYLTLSYYHMKDGATAQEYLNKAEDILGEDNLLSIDMDISAKNDLERLIYTYKASGTTLGLRMLPKLPEENLASGQVSSIEQLEQMIKQNSRNSTIYYDLYQIYRETYNFNGAKKTIEELVKKIPQEVYGYYLLGIIQYQEKEYKDANESFENFFELTYGKRMRDEIVLEVKAYQILSNYLRGEREKTESLVKESINILTREKIRALPLGSKDLAILLGLIDTFIE
jgi:tetratricopeptide (TPR) repeat protein